MRALKATVQFDAVFDIEQDLDVPVPVVFDSNRLEERLVETDGRWVDFHQGGDEGAIAAHLKLPGTGQQMRIRRKWKPVKEDDLRPRIRADTFERILRYMGELTLLELATKGRFERRPVVLVKAKAHLNLLGVAHHLKTHTVGNAREMFQEAL